MEPPEKPDKPRARRVSIQPGQVLLPFAGAEEANFGAPAHRHAGDTENAAAASASLVSGKTRRVVLKAFIRRASEDGGGYTDEELAKATGLRHYTAAPRRGELVKLGLVVDSGIRRPTTSGHNAIVWKFRDE